MDKEELYQQRIIDSVIQKFECHQINVPFDIYDVQDISNEIVELIRQKELTYAQAYASLEIAFQMLKYESNFVPIQSP